MTQRSLNFSSKRRKKIGMSKACDFTIKFDPVWKLSSDMTHDIAVNRILMTYSFHNITPEYESSTRDLKIPRNRCLGNG